MDFGGPAPERHCQTSHNQILELSLLLTIRCAQWLPSIARLSGGSIGAHTDLDLSNTHAMPAGCRDSRYERHDSRRGERDRDRSLRRDDDEKKRERDRDRDRDRARDRDRDRDRERGSAKDRDRERDRNRER